jgi:hypothetical protein
MYSIKSKREIRNIKTGEQPAHLFEIPKDFKGSYLPAGGMLEMFTGKSQEQQINDVLKLVEGTKK